MIQILFFLSMLCMTAMLLKLFWYLDDSHEEEMRINIMNYRKRFLHTQGSSYISSSDMTYRFTGNYRTSINAGYRTSKQRASAIRRPAGFYDVGMLPDSDTVSTSGKQSECA
ncbi:MAG: hypothetical protein ACYCYI_00595 [Saccharofermentanales bacterium]